MLSSSFPYSYLRSWGRTSILAVGIAIALLARPVARAAETPPFAPEDFLGRWWGDVHHNADRRAIGFEFSRAENRTIRVRLWLPELNAYGASIGTLRIDGATVSIPEWGIPLVLRSGEISGCLSQPDLLFAVRPTSTLAEEPAIPALPSGPPAFWTLATGPLCATPATVGDSVIVGDTTGVVQAVGVHDGAIRWTHQVGGPVYGPIAVDGSALFVADDSGHVSRLNAETGREIWCRLIGPKEAKHAIPDHFGDMEWDFAGPEPVVEDGVVYVASADHQLHAIDANTGAERWQFTAGERIRGGVALVGDKVVFGSRDNFVYALGRTEGKLRWKFDTRSPVNSTPVFDEGRIFIGTRDQALLYSLAADTGTPVWSSYYWLSWVESTPALVDGMLYIGSSDLRRVSAFDPATGVARWATQVWGWSWGTPLVVNDTVYFGTAGAPEYFVRQQASLGALDRKTGALRWRIALPQPPKGYLHGVAASLVACQGKLIAAGVDGWLAAYPLQ